MGLSRASSREFVRRASNDIIFPVVTRPLLYIFHFVVWGGRKIIDLTRGVKEMILGVKHPELEGWGWIFAQSGLSEKSECVALAARIVCVVRPLIKLSEAGHEIKESANGLASCVFEDTEVACAYLKTRGTLSKFSQSKVGFFINHRLPLFAQRLWKVISDTLFVTIYSCDMSETLTANQKDIDRRCFAELKETVDHVGKKQLLRAIDFHASWINGILHKFNPKLNVSAVKKIITIAIRASAARNKAVEGANDIMLKGILGMG